MKRINFFLMLMLVLGIAASSCKKYDDTSLWNAVNRNASEIAQLKAQCAQLNTDISTLRAIVDAIQRNEYIIGCTPLSDGSGYAITFSSGVSIVVKNGTDGKDAHMPVISVKMDEDGCYYWTLDGEWLLDAGGRRIKAEGKDGQDGVTPELKIEDGYWYVTVDGGQTWTVLGESKGADGIDGENGETLIRAVRIEDGYVKFILNDEESTVLKLAFVKETELLSIEIAEAGTIAGYIDEKEAAGIDKLVCRGEIGPDDIDFIYNFVTNATCIDLSGCRFVGQTGSYSPSASNVRNPYLERQLEDTILPAGLTRFECVYPYLKSLTYSSSMLQDGEGCTRLPLCQYLTFSYDGTSAKVNRRVIDRVGYAEGVADIHARLSSDATVATPVCDTLVLPASLTTIVNTAFFIGGDFQQAECYEFKEAAVIVCKAQTPPALYSTDEHLSPGAFYCFVSQTATGTIDYALPFTNTLMVPAGSIGLYRQAPGWSQFLNVTPIE